MQLQHIVAGMQQQTSAADPGGDKLQQQQQQQQHNITKLKGDTRDTGSRDKETPRNTSISNAHA